MPISFWEALEKEKPLQVVGAVNAYAALLAKKAGFRAIYLSGAGVANHSFGLPDLAMTTLNDVCEDIRRITYSCDLPLLVDADTGWGDTFMIGRTVREINRAGASGCHIEDQVSSKRCGHRPGKKLVSADEMTDRIKSAVDARTDDSFIIMARTDAHAIEGQASAIERAQSYVEAGADIIFAEALTTLAEYKQFTSAIDVPVLANLTEFGMTPLFTASRAMAKAAKTIYQEIKLQGTQKHVIDNMQTRTELYEVLKYHEYEEKLDVLFVEEGIAKQSVKKEIDKARKNNE